MNAKDILRSLQLHQLHHDMKAHQDVFYMALPDRMTHFALHLAKYSGRLAQKGMSENLVRTAVDAFIICLAASNALKVQITDYLDQQQLEHNDNMKSLGLSLYRNADSTEEISDWCFRQFALGAGELATACEYLQHIEPAPYRKLIVDSLARICRASIVGLSMMSVDIESAVRSRWHEIENR